MKMKQLEFMELPPSLKPVLESVSRNNLTD